MEETWCQMADRLIIGKKTGKDGKITEELVLEIYEKGEKVPVIEDESTLDEDIGEEEE